MNNENNNLNTEPVVVNTNPVPTTQPVNDKFMTVSDINQINQPVQPVVQPEPVVPQPVIAPPVEPTTNPVMAPVEPQMGPVVNTEPVVNPVPTVTPQPQDPNAMVNENLKKVEIKDYTPPSKFKIFILLVFFIGLVAFIIFLPDISSYLSTYGKNQYNKQDETITTGKLICDLTSNTASLDKEYEFVFSFTDSKLKKTKYVLYTRGDTTTEDTLDELAENCKTLKEESSKVEGVSIKCEYSDGKLTETQVFELESINEEELKAAFTEAGGMLPSYTYDQNIDDIEKNMKASGYTCERQK